MLQKWGCSWLNCIGKSKQKIWSSFDYLYDLFLIYMSAVQNMYMFKKFPIFWESEESCMGLHCTVPHTVTNFDHSCYYYSIKFTKVIITQFFRNFYYCLLFISEPASHVIFLPVYKRTGPSFPSIISITTWIGAGPGPINLKPCCRVVMGPVRRAVTGLVYNDVTGPVHHVFTGPVYRNHRAGRTDVAEKFPCCHGAKVVMGPVCHLVLGLFHQESWDQFERFFMV